MGTRTEHAPGAFSFVELMARDVAGAKEFYGRLFGWEFEDREVPGGGGAYSRCKVDGEYVAAIAPIDESRPRWDNYVTVASADDAAATAAELGAEVTTEPLDVGDAGRMATFTDPTGAPLCVWEPGESIGATRVNDPGSLTWNELHTPDPDRALEFYTGLFGWSTEEVDTHGGPRYTTVKLRDRPNGAVMGGEARCWLPYFVVEDRDAAAEQATALGAKELSRMDIAESRIAAFADPQGAMFAVFEGEVDD
jgi:predicted enzyme related to lactoylglutathione lyase